MPRRPHALLAAALVATACGSTTVADTTFDRDLDAARARWAAGRPAAYAFELEITTVWVPSRGYTRIDVRNDSVIAVRTADGDAPLARGAGVTIDGIYAQLAAARDRGESLTALRFDAAGVPLEAMVGTFANDGGVHYAVRRFTRGR